MTGLIHDLKEAIKFVKLYFEKYPSHCESGNEISFFILKHNCPVCMEDPIERLSNFEYHKKYPAENVITLGRQRIYLCNEHYKALRDKMNETEI